MAAAETHDRQVWIDVAKGVGICLVVFGHATNGIITAGIAPAGFAQEFYFFVYTFHMPLFFFLAGITVHASLKKGEIDFIRNKLSTIAYPYFIWSIAQGSVQLAASSQLNSPFEITYLLQIPIQPIGHFWFLYVLFFYHLITAATKENILVLGAMGVALLALQPYASEFHVEACHNFIFYVAGMAVQRFAPQVTISALNTTLLGAAALLLCAGLSTALGPYLEWSYLSLATLPLAALGIAGVVLLCRAMTPSPLRTVAEFLGRRALSIYVMHIMACAGSRVVLSRMGLSVDPLTWLVLCTFLGITLPLLAHEVFKRLGMLEALGLARRIRTSPPRRVAG